jgi:uncharacterized cupin superfamily protein
MERFPVAAVRARLEDKGGGWEVVHRSHNLEVGVLARLAPATDPPARHADDEMYLVLDGEATLEFDDQRYRLGEGDAAFVPAGMQHHCVDYERITVRTVGLRQQAVDVGGRWVDVGTAKRRPPSKPKQRVNRRK